MTEREASNGIDLAYLLSVQADVVSTCGAGVLQFRRFSVEVPRASSPSQLAQLVERWVQDTESRQVGRVCLFI